VEDPFLAGKAAMEQYGASNRALIVPFLVKLDKEMRQQGLNKYVRDRILVNTHQRLFLQPPDNER
jgi:DNA topoisomerase VI subunit B